MLCKHHNLRPSSKAHKEIVSVVALTAQQWQVFVLMRLVFDRVILGLMADTNYSRVARNQALEFSILLAFNPLKLYFYGMEIHHLMVLFCLIVIAWRVYFSNRVVGLSRTPLSTKLIRVVKQTTFCKFSALTASKLRGNRSWFASKT